MPVSLSDSKSAELYARALTRLPGGVNSPVRAMRAIGRDPIFIDRAEGAEIVDVDGNRYVDYVCSWGPLIAGHAHPDILAAVGDIVRNLVLAVRGASMVLATWQPKRRSGRGLSHHHLEKIAVAVRPQDPALCHEQLA